MRGIDAMGFLRRGECVRTCLFIILSVIAVRCTATVVVIGKNVSLSFDDIEANFAPAIKSSGMSGILYAVEPLDACSPLTDNPEEGSSSFALIVRGSCPFDEKVMAAQKAGFAAAIIYDDIDGGALVAMAGSSAGIRISAVFVSKAAGEALKEFADRGDVDVWIVPTFESSAWSIVAIAFISLLAMSAVLATCFFVRRHRVRRDRPRAGGTRESQGMSKQLVKAMPSLLFTSALEDNCTSRTCAICLEDYDVGELIRILPCRHKFHAQCVDSWLTTWRTFCPVCKRDARSIPAGPLPSEATPLLAAASAAGVSPSSSFRQPSPSPSPSHAIQILPSPSSASIPRHPNSHRRRHHLCDSPATAAAGAAPAMNRNSASHRSLASLLASSHSLSFLPHSLSVASISVRGSSIGSPSYLAGSHSHRRSSFQNSPSAASLSAASLPDC